LFRFITLQCGLSSSGDKSCTPFFNELQKDPAVTLLISQDVSTSHIFRMAKGLKYALFSVKYAMKNNMKFGVAKLPAF